MNLEIINLQVSLDASLLKCMSQPLYYSHICITLTSDPEKLFNNVHSHDVPSFIEITPLNTEILCHVEQC